MAWFTYDCKEHGNFRVSLKVRLPEQQCPICGVASVPVIKAATVQVVERLDNGAMARRVERLHNVEEIMKVRGEKSSREARERRGDAEDED